MDEQGTAILWKQRASEIENAGFIRFAAALRELEKSYYREAERIKEEDRLEQDSMNRGK